MNKRLDALYIEIFGPDSLEVSKNTALPDIPTLDIADTDVKKASRGWYRPAQQVEHEQLLNDLAPLENDTEYTHIVPCQKVVNEEEREFREAERPGKRAGKVSRKAYLSRKFDSYYKTDIRTKFNQAIEQLAKQTHLSGDALNAQFIKLISN